METTIFWKVRGMKTDYAPLSIPSSASVADLRNSLKNHLISPSMTSLEIVLYSEGNSVSVLADLTPATLYKKVLVQRLHIDEAKKLIENANRLYDASALESSTRQESLKTGSQHTAVQTRSSDAPPQYDKSSKGDTILNKGLNSIRGKRARSDESGDHQNDTCTKGDDRGASHEPDIDSSSDSSGRAAAGSLGESVSKLAPNLTITSSGLGGVSKRELSEDEKLAAVMRQHAQHRGPSTAAGMPESLAHRYHRNKNASWAREMGESTSIQPDGVGHPPSPPGTSRRYSHSQSHLTPQPRGMAVTGVSYLKFPLPNNYICHMCGEGGHHIKECPIAASNKHQKKVKQATGIPANFLRKIRPEEIKDYQEVYLMKDNQYAVMRSIETVSGGAYFSKSVDQRIQSRLGGGVGGSLSENIGNVAAHFKCPICHKVFSNPVLTPCCGETFCKFCLFNCFSQPGPVKKSSDGSSSPYALSSICPSCGAFLNPSEITFNRAVKDSVDAIFKGSSSFVDLQKTTGNPGIAAKRDTFRRDGVGLSTSEGLKR